jgi:hypothetical protein
MEELQSEMPLRLSTADGDITTVAIVDRETEQWLRNKLAHKAAVDIRVREPEGDVVGHQASADTIVVVVSMPDGDDDVAGHAMSLRFPNMAAAKDFERRMLATGLLVVTVAAGAAGVGIASQTSRVGAPAQPLAAPDPGAYAPAIRDTDRDLSSPAQYAPTVRDTDRDLSAPAQYAPTVRDTDRDLSAPAQYAPAVRDTDRNLDRTDAGAAAQQAPYVPTYAPFDVQAQGTGSAQAPTSQGTDRNLDRAGGDAIAQQAPYNPTYAPFDVQAQGSDSAQAAPDSQGSDRNMDRADSGGSAPATPDSGGDLKHK